MSHLVPRLRVVGWIQRSVGVRSIALTGLFILAVFNAVYFMCSILPIESEVSRYLFTITAINACRASAVGTAVELLSLAQHGSQHSRREMRPRR
jgi:hypothetical protein